MALCKCGRQGPASTSQAHCTSCHRQFGGVSGFDAHRRGSFEPDNRHCVDPATVLDGHGQPRYREADSPYGPIWRTTEDVSARFPATGSENQPLSGVS